MSVVIPAHDPGPWLDETLHSIRAQTFRDWELVVVDDGSTQDLGFVAREVPEARLIRQDPAGASVARNRGVLATDGELVAFMDHDDLWTPAKLAHQVAALDAHPEAGLCYCDLQSFRPPERPDLHATAEPSPPVAVELGDDSARLRASLALFGQAFVVPSTVMVRRSSLAAAGLLDPWMPFTGDFDLLIRLGSAQPVVHVASTDVWYRTHDANFSLHYDQGRRELRQLRRRYSRMAQAQRDWALLRQAQTSLRRPRRLYAWQAMDRARLAWRGHDVRATGYHLARSLGFDPRVALDAVGHRVRPGRG